MLLVSGCPAHVQVDTEASEKRYLLGADLYGKGLIAPALEELLKAVQLNPDNAEAHNLLGIVYLRKGVETEDLATRSQCLRGDALGLEKQDADASFTKAEKEFREAVRVKADFSDAWNNLAVVAQHFGRFDEAITAAEHALANIVYREPWAAQGNLGLAYLSKGDLVRAAAALRKALFDQPKFCVGHYRLAQVYKQQNELEHAREELELLFADKACPIQEAYHLGGLVTLKLGDRERARVLLSRCLELAPRSCLAKECSMVP
jgi:Flp pilus assembly protein TadD